VGSSHEHLEYFKTDSRNPAWCITRIAGCNTLARNI
jgi:hypothetical protein